jgi:L-amino acid N-acyltransferase YncA
MSLVECTFDHAPEILEIFNHEIAHSTGLYDYHPRTLDFMGTWFEGKRTGKYPVLGVVGPDGSLSGFSSLGPFRPFPAYKYSVEHSVYVRKDRRGQGIGRLLLQEIVARAAALNFHTVIGGIDSQNHASIKLHLSLGFTHCASIKQAGFKFGRWLDLEFYQTVLDTPVAPVDG